MCKLIIHSEGIVAEDKINTDTIKDIKKEIRKFSPDAKISVDFRSEK